MIDIHHLCPGCMGNWPDPAVPCPRCGFSWEKLPPPGRALPPFTILAGRYLLGTRLGAGGFGITYLAMDLNEETPVAIKEFFPSSLAGRENKQVLPLPGEEGRTFREALRSFRREGELMARFRGVKGIVSWRDTLEENGTAYLVMDYVPGETLMRRMRRTGAVFSQREALDLMGPILRAVDAMHQQHVLHRDISPENLILKPDGTLTLIDFGAAREFDLEEEENLTVILKRGYAPEEQYRSGSRQGPWTDLYACCAVLYQMVSGIRPQDAHQRREKDLLIPLDELEGVEVTHGFARAVEKGLTVHATERYPSIRALLEDLEPGTPEASIPPAPKPEAPLASPPKEDVAPPVPSPEPEKVHGDELAPSPRELAFSRAARFSPPPPRKKPPLWALAGAAVLALGLVIFLGRSLKFGGDTSAAPDELPDIYGNLQEDGTTWVECESLEYQGEADLSTGLIQWNLQSQSETEWTFSETGTERATTRSTEEDPDSMEKVYTYDTQGQLVSVYAGTLLLEEHQYDYDEHTRTSATYNEDGTLTSITTTQYDNSGQYSNGHIRDYAAEEYDPETGAVCASETITFHAYDDVSYEADSVRSTADGSELTQVYARFRNDDQPLEETTTSEDSSGRYTQTSTYTYDSDGNCLSKVRVMTEEVDGQEIVSRVEESYSYQFDGESRILKRTSTISQEELGTRIVHTLYNYDELGNLLSEMEYAEGETEVWLTSYTYAQYAHKDGYIFEATGTVSGSSEPVWSELPEDAFATSASGADLGFLDLLNILGVVGDSLEYPQYYDSAEGVMAALDAGAIDFVLDAEIHDLASVQNEGYCLIPPISLDGLEEGDSFSAIMTADMNLCWEITMFLLDEGYYPEEGFWYGFFFSLRDNEGSSIAYQASDSLHEKLMRPYLDYWSQQTDGTYTLTLQGDTPSQEEPPGASVPAAGGSESSSPASSIGGSGTQSSMPELITLTGTIPTEAEKDAFIQYGGLYYQYSVTQGLLVSGFSGGLKLDAPVTLTDPNSGEAASTTQVVLMTGIVPPAPYEDVEVLRFSDFEPGKRYSVQGFWLDPAQHWGQGSWQDDHLFGPTHSNEAGDWYKVYFYGRYLFVPVSAQRLD